jgi:hypothetical protein
MEHRAMRINYKAFESLIYQLRAGKISKALFVIEWGDAQKSQGIAAPKPKEERMINA